MLLHEGQKKNMKDTLILFGKTPHQLLMSYEDKSYSSRIPFNISIVINIPSIHIMIDPEFNTCPGMKVPCHYVV